MLQTLNSGVLLTSLSTSSCVMMSTGSGNDWSVRQANGLVVKLDFNVLDKRIDKLLGIFKFGRIS